MNTPDFQMRPENFAKNLTEFLDMMGMTEMELAQRAKIQTSVIESIVRGQRQPDLPTLCAILTVIPIKFERLVR